VLCYVQHPGLVYFWSGACFCQIAFRKRDGDFDGLVMEVETIVELIPYLVDCGKVLLVSDVGFGLLGEPIFPL
jgi:hypothetical protein